MESDGAFAAEPRRERDRVTRLSRSAVLFCLFLLPLLVPVCSPGAFATELKLAHRWLANEDARDLAVRVFIRELRKQAPGLSVSLQSPSALGIPPGAELDAVLTGKIDLALYPLEHAVPKIPELSVVLMPGVPSDLEAAAQLKGSKFHELLQELTEANGFRILTWWWMPGGFVSTERPILSPKSVAGVRVGGGQPNFDRLLAAAGARIEQSAFAEMVPSALSSAIQGGFTAYETIAADRLHERARYVTGGRYSLWMTLVPLIIANDRWQKFSVEERQAFEKAAEIADAFFEQTQTDAEQRAAQAVSKAGGQVDELGWADYESWMTIAKDASWLEYRRLSPTANELFLMMVENVIRPEPDLRPKADGRRSP